MHKQLTTINIVLILSLFGSFLSVDICTFVLKAAVVNITNKFSLFLGQKGLFFPGPASHQFKFAWLPY